ncbi:hypothetical protein M501DRAFT_1009879 [Patellaria atrata CBS 101060]|uniref:BZIP domain-containing protein n=1 Tax=Patellaria atrata CBS 101060 TaxID=1346257 RepID=A0A9P4SDK6_9PEZI|nr:hypothetical protein M501DRAFT_1009879 [Patellaria atrata CBS 101060]
MSVYNGRRGPNVSQYVAGLNTIPTTNEIPQEQNFLDNDLAMFTNTEFFDFENIDTDFSKLGEFSGEGPDGLPPAPFHSNHNSAVLNNDFAVPDFSSYPHLSHDSTSANLQSSQHNQYAFQNITSPVSASPISARPSVAGDKRKLDALSPTSNVAMEEASRLAADEDKRRRNTAASARFRVKKKQREQALEKSAKEMTEKVHTLETRVGQLEMENRWLKNLITEKNDGKADIQELYKQFTKEKEAAEARSNGEHTDGVGTRSTKE